MGVLAAIGAIIQAMPEIAKFLNTIVSVIEQLKKAAAEKEINQWLLDLDTNLKKIGIAKTTQEKIDAARALADLVKHLG